MKPSFYIFDLDGTLVDSFRDIASSVNLTLEEMGHGSLELEQIQSHIGQGARWLLERCLEQVGGLEEGALERARELFLPLYTEHIADHTRPFPGVVETLEQLQQRGLPMALCSNKPYALVAVLLERLELKRFFPVALGGDSLARKKPDPAPLLHLMERFGQKPAETLMIGDSRFDIEAGREAGTLTCAVTYGHLSPQEARDLAPTLLVDALYQLL